MSKERAPALFTVMMGVVLSFAKGQIFGARRYRRGRTELKRRRNPKGYAEAEAMP